MDSNIPATPAYGDNISQLVKYARICTAKADFMHRLRSLSSRLKQQGFKSTLYFLNRLKNSSNVIAQQWLNIMLHYGNYDRQFVIEKYHSSSMYPLLTCKFKCFYLF